MVFVCTPFVCTALGYMSGAKPSRIFVEFLIYSSMSVVALLTSNTWADAVSGTFLVGSWIIMSGGSPLSWIGCIASQLVTDAHWARFMGGLLSSVGRDINSFDKTCWTIFCGLIEKETEQVSCAWPMAASIVGLFVAVYLLHGSMLLPFDLHAYWREVSKPWKVQPGVYLVRHQTKKLVRTLVVNFFVTACFGLILAADAAWSHSTRGIRFTMTLPSKLEQLACFWIGLLWNETIFYWSHRALHHPQLYRMFHKQHHEYTAPFALAALYCGPLEMVISNLFAFMGICWIGRYHLFFVYCWVLHAVMGTQVHHSGYKFPWITIMDHQPHVHDLHHKNFNCNYGNIGLFDKLCGTDKDPFQVKAKKCE